jgi:hypothetical protein
MSPQTMPPSCLGKGKVLTDKFNRRSHRGRSQPIRDHRFDHCGRGEAKEIGKKPMEFTAAADNGLLWHQNNGGAMVQIAMDSLPPEPDDSTAEIE